MHKPASKGVVIAALVALAFSPAAAQSPPVGGGVASELADIGPAHEITLTNQEGLPFQLSRLRGKAVVVSFIYTTCTGTCPATTASLIRIQEALRKEGLWRENVEFVSVSLDPGRDTPDVLKRYAKAFGADPAAWHFLTGDPNAVARVHADWGMWARIGPNGAIDHPSRIFLVDPEGHQREIYSLEFLKPETLVRDVRTAISDPVRR